MFKGSKNVEPESHTSIIASVGGRSNAYTTEDETVFWQTLPAQYLPLVLWMEADRMATLRVDDEAFRREREVVKEERRMRVENQPYGRLTEIIYDHAFTTHPYKHPTIGSMADLEAASIDDVREFHSTFYVPENATLTIVGDFDAAQALQLVTQYFGRVPKALKPVPRDIPKEPAQTKEKRAVVEEAWPLPAVVVAYHVTYDGHPDSYPLHITSKILSDGQSARIPARAGLQQAAGADRVRQRQHHRGSEPVLRRRHRAAGRRRREAAEKALIAEFEKLKTRAGHRPRAAARQEPVRARLHRRPRVEPGEGAAPGARRGHPQRHHHRRRRVRHLHERRRTADVQRVARTYFNETNRVVLHILPKARAGRDEHARRPVRPVTLCGWRRECSAPRWLVARSPASRRLRNWPSERPPRPLPAREVKFPPYEVRTLANGMQVIAVLHHEQPAVTHAAAGARRRGAGSAGQGRASRAWSAQLLDQGTTTRSARADRRSDRLHRRRARHRLGQPT